MPQSGSGPIIIKKLFQHFHTSAADMPFRTLLFWCKVIYHNEIYNFWPRCFYNLNKAPELCPKILLFQTMLRFIWHVQERELIFISLDSWKKSKHISDYLSLVLFQWPFKYLIQWSSFPHAKLRVQCSNVLWGGF